MKVLFDEDVPRKLARSLSQHEIHTVVSTQWGGIKNGALLKLIELEFPWLLTKRSPVPSSLLIATCSFHVPDARANSTAAASESLRKFPLSETLPIEPQRHADRFFEIIVQNQKDNQ